MGLVQETAEGALYPRADPLSLGANGLGRSWKLLLTRDALKKEPEW
jgi:hypothetical protein